MRGIIFRFGILFSLPEGETFRGFLRPINPPAGKEIRHSRVPGIVTEGDYLLIAPPGRFEHGDFGTLIKCGGDVYKLLRVERKFVGGDESHSECLLRLVERGT